MAGSSFYYTQTTTPQPTVEQTTSGNAEHSSSFFETNPTPETTPGLFTALVEATDAANALNRYYVVYENTYDPAISINWNLANNHRLTLTGNTTLTFSGGRDGDRLIIDIKMDSVGGHSVTFPSNVRYGTTLPAIILSTEANRLNKIGFMYNSTDDKYDLVSAAYGLL